jgi:hypothetical protein
MLWSLIFALIAASPFLLIGIKEWRSSKKDMNYYPGFVSNYDDRSN